MSSALDMSLDDIIKTNKKSGSSSSRGGRGRGGAAGSGPGPTRRPQNHRGNNRATPYSTNTQAPESAWKHDMFADQGMGFVTQAAGARGNASIETGTKLYISNLEYGVSNEDIKELFSEVGDLKRNTIHYDRSGRSKGTAEVVFSRRSDAVAAVKRYNNVQLDGKPMKIEIVGTNITTQPAPSFPANAAFGNGIPRSGGRGGALGRIRGGGGGGGFGGNRGGGFGGNRGGRGSGRGRGRGRDEKISPEDLDADLEKYHSEAMQTN